MAVLEAVAHTVLARARGIHATMVHKVAAGTLGLGGR